MKLSLFGRVCAVVAAGLLASQAMAATVVFSDNFDAENGGVGALNYTGFAQWTVSDGTVDLIGNGYFDFLPGNGLYIDMDGSTNNAGKMTSIDIALAPGLYELSFDLAGNHRNNALEQVIVEVNMGGLLSETFSLAQNDPFTTFTRQFSVAAPTIVNLSFEGVGGDNIGMLLDNVAVTLVPLPAAAWVGLAMIGGIAVRRKLRRA
jgi:hypothetical protein